MTATADAGVLYGPGRFAAARRAMAAAGLDALVLTPGGDLRYLTGYDALAMERLTCLVLPVEGGPTLIVPTLERPAAEAALAPGLGMTIVDHPDGVDPYPLVAEAAGGGSGGVLGVSDRMWAAQLLAVGAALPGWKQRLASPVLAEMRIRKNPAEVAALREAGEAIDAVHRRMGEWLRPGRTEAAVAADIGQAILDAGHARVDFTIVGSGPNGASPHHSVSSRIIEPGDVVVVDIGGTMPSGYCSDCTRTYVVGGPAPAGFRRAFDALYVAQRAAVAAAMAGATAASVDGVARTLLAEAGYGPNFLHRTGHGIGLETHEEPYIVAGNDRALEPGMAFSVEPGVYVAGSFGARIEDIVVCGEDGPRRMNTTDTSLVEL